MRTHKCQETANSYLKWRKQTKKKKNKASVEVILILRSLPITAADRVKRNAFEESHGGKKRAS